MNKQQEQVKIGVYFFNGAYRPFAGYPKSISVWNSRVEYKPDYLGSASSVSLSGLGKANPSGYRPFVNITLDNARGSQVESIMKILNRLANQYDRIVFPETGTSNISNKTSNTFTLTLAGLASNNGFYEKCVVFNSAEDSYAPVTGYTFTGGVGTFTVSENISAWTNGDAVTVLARPNLPSYIGVSIDDTNTNVIHCMAESATLGAMRELTIADSLVSMTLKGRERTNSIPSTIVI